MGMRKRCWPAQQSKSSTRGTTFRVCQGLKGRCVLGFTSIGRPRRYSPAGGSTPALSLPALIPSRRPAPPPQRKRSVQGRPEPDRPCRVVRLVRERQTMTSSMVGSSRRKSSGSLVTTRWWRERAQSTTEASITSAVPATPQSWPAALAPRSSSATTAQELDPRSRARLAWRRPSRHTWPTTPAGTTNGSLRSRVRAIRRTTLLLPRSKPTRAPVSKVRPLTTNRLPGRPRLAPRR